MLFTSWAFLLAFLPLTLAGFHLYARARDYRLALGWLIAASCLFHALWNPVLLVVLLASIATNARIGQALTRRPSTALLALGVGANLATLGVFGYSGVFADTLAVPTGIGLPTVEQLLPLGIPFFTLQQIGWLVDVRRGARTGSLLEHALFASFFPASIAGPIVRHAEIVPQFRRTEMGTHTARNLSVGSAFVAIGLFKKVVLADSVAPFATPVFVLAETGTAPAFAEAWTGAIAFSLQLYFGFSGYSDMAIGLARLFGVVLPASFDSPYRSHAIIDFWHRWHMTLSRFLHDYLYVPFGGNGTGAGRTRACLVLMLTLLLGGLWHGAAWTFLACGALHGVYLLINHAWRRRRRAATAPIRERRLPWGQALTLLAVIVAWVPFRAETLSGASGVLAAMAGLHGLDVPVALGPLAERINTFVGATLLSADGAFPHRPFEPAAALGWIVPLCALALFAPNSQQWLREQHPVLTAPRSPTGLAARLVWRPTATGAVTVAALLLVAAWYPSGSGAFLVR